MKRHIIFFDLGQTLINEWNFIDFFDMKFIEILNGFGARIDKRIYKAIRDSVIRNRSIGSGGIKELVIEVCRLITQQHYHKLIVDRLEPQILEWQKNLFRFFDDAPETITNLSKQYELGIIANQTVDSLKLLNHYNLNQFFKIKVISSEVKLKKPDPRIFTLAMKLALSKPEDCIMIGDRLDTDIGPANELGLTTIRTENSLFKLQQPTDKFEQPTYTVAKLSEIPQVLHNL
jgi:HAD superfamily hydrolase (TIGR01549 family)